VRPTVRPEGGPVVNGYSESVASRELHSVVILTALRTECEAVLEHIGRLRTTETLGGGTIYELGRFEGEHIDWSVAVAEIGAGNESAAVEATNAIHELKPDLLMFVGVAGSLKPDDVPYGAVVVVDTVHGYQSGKDSEEFAPRSITFRTGHRLSQLVRQVGRSDWSGGRQISVHLGPVAAGNVVVGSSKSRTYDLIRRYHGDALAVEMESLGLYLAADRAGRLPALSVRGISDCVDDKTARADLERQPIAAKNAALFAFAMLKAIRPADIDAPLRIAEKPPETNALDWASVPFSSAECLQRAMDSNREEVARLLSVLAGCRANPQAAVDELLLATPQWLSNAASDLLWGAIGEFALSHNLQASAADAFRRAAGAGGDEALWLVLSAIALAFTGRHDQALENLVRATGESEEFPVPLARAVIEADTEEILRLTAEADGTCVRPSSYRVQALHVDHRIPEAIDLAERVVAHHPGAAGVALQLATLLTTAAREDSSPIGYEPSLLRARDLALTARDLRRGWGGDSVEAVVIAGRASIMLNDPVTALRISSHPPEGMALQSEAADDPVRHIRVNALVLLRRAEDGLSEAAEFSDQIMRRIAEADCLSAMGRKDRAERLYVEAADALVAGSLDDPQAAGLLFLGLSGLAQLGVTPVTHMDRLKAIDPDNARRVEVLSDIATGETKRAIQAVRTGGQSGDVPLLAIALAEAGQTDDAVSVLTDAADRFGRAEYRLQAVHILAREQRYKEAYGEVVGALADTPDGTPLKAQLRKTAVQVAAMIPDWDAVCKQAKVAAVAGDRTDEMRWALVTALNNTLSPEDALAEATCPPALKPRNEQEARLLLSLHSGRGGGLESIAAVLDIAEAFPASEQVGAAAVGCVLVLSKDIALPEGMRERLTRASDNFFDRYPDSNHLKRIQVTPENPEELFTHLRASAGRQDTQAMQEVVERIRAGTLPLAFLSHVLNRPYAELIVKRGIDWIIGESRDEEVRERERSDAANAVGHQVVVETSAIFGAMLTELLPTTLLGAFSHTPVAAVSVEDAINSASELALRSTSFIGWDRLHGSPVLDERTPEEADRWAHDAQEIERIMRSSTAKAATRRADDVDKLPLIMEPIRLASEMRLAIYSDDIALRLLAASEGVPAFGTASLLVAAQGYDLLDSVQVAAATDALRRHRYADLDWSADDLLRIADRENYLASGGASGALARPGFWSDPLEAIASYRSLLARLAEVDASAETIEGWHASATYGLLGRVDPISRAEAAGELLATAFVVFGLQPIALPSLLVGARHGSEARRTTDPLPCFCGVLSRVLSGLFGQAQGGRIYVEMMQQLTPEDRAVALRELLAGTGPEGRAEDPDDHER